MSPVECMSVFFLITLVCSVTSRMSSATVTVTLTETSPFLLATWRVKCHPSRLTCHPSGQWPLELDNFSSCEQLKLPIQLFWMKFDIRQRYSKDLINHLHLLQLSPAQTTRNKQCKETLRDVWTSNTTLWLVNTVVYKKTLWYVTQAQ